VYSVHNNMDKMVASVYYITANNYILSIIFMDKWLYLTMEIPSSPSIFVSTSVHQVEEGFNE